MIDSSIIRDINILGQAEKNIKTIDDFQPVFKRTGVLNMLNTKYLIYNSQAPPLVNRSALGNAWFAEDPVFAADANDELSTLNKINTAREAVIDDVFKTLVSKTSYPVAEGDTIRLLSYEPDKMIYKYSAQSEKLIVFSEIYYPAGWKCFLDGKQTDYFRADYVLRAMVAPAGTHEIKFVFEPSSYIIGNKVSLASSVLLILLLAGFLVMKFIKVRSAG